MAVHHGEHDGCGEKLARLVLRFPQKRKWIRVSDLKPEPGITSDEDWANAVKILKGGQRRGFNAKEMTDKCMQVTDATDMGDFEMGRIAVSYVLKSPSNGEETVVYFDDRVEWDINSHQTMMKQLSSANVDKALEVADVDSRNALRRFHDMVNDAHTVATLESLASKPIGEWIGVLDAENRIIVFLRMPALLDLPAGHAFQDISVVLHLDKRKVTIKRLGQPVIVPNFSEDVNSCDELTEVLSRASKLMICHGDNFSHPQYAMKKAETFGEMSEELQQNFQQLTCGQRIVVGGGVSGNTIHRAVEVGVNPGTGASGHLVRAKECQLAFDPVSKRARRCGPCQKMLKKLSVDEKSLQETVTSQKVSKFTPVNSMSRQELKLRVLELSGEKKNMQRKRPKLSASNTDIMIPTPSAEEDDDPKDDHSHHIRPPEGSHDSLQHHSSPINPHSHNSHHHISNHGRLAQTQMHHSPHPNLLHTHSHSPAHQHQLTHEHMQHSEHSSASQLIPPQDGNRYAMINSEMLQQNASTLRDARNPFPHENPSFMSLAREGLAQQQGPSMSSHDGHHQDENLEQQQQQIRRQQAPQQHHHSNAHY
mmetsp:Transcript_18854/g.37010  ORF Transcript_18854/g.37010 Transcript_18854/m.37010 type:complete len:593 (-) Transcript_18854:814-2592(-)|eukprot:CAMPEP_0171559368 /NCGR_PEP_ID=MMETSP0960-20121227/12771_1 /TAXON_ID=87120 /ORGANISM="Aurantiochytrium limacinum, Strain ATCCMYA-1381" /LENGTH=592 /DNA_ID=CAMNT_0012110787 /DNA_START=13 /DNA_END=1791 /DNA_ORIENTATION=-